jgi:MFS family permease
MLIHPTAWNGGSIFTYYYTIVFSAAGITDPHIQFGITAVQNASWCVGGIVGGYLLDIWGRRTNYLIGTGQAALCLIIQGGLALGIFDKGIVNHAAGAGFVSIYIIQWFLWVTFFSPGMSTLSTHTGCILIVAQLSTCCRPRYTLQVYVQEVTLSPMSSRWVLVLPLSTRPYRCIDT